MAALSGTLRTAEEYNDGKATRQHEVTTPKALHMKSSHDQMTHMCLSGGLNDMLV